MSAGASPETQQSTKNPTACFLSLFTGNIRLFTDLVLKMHIHACMFVTESIICLILKHIIMKPQNKMENTDYQNSRKSHSQGGMNTAKRVFLGVVLVGAGLVWLGANLNYIDEIVKEYIISWQALLIAVGIMGLLGRKSNLWFSVVLIFTGGLFLFAKYNELPVDASLVFWPVILILVGLAFLTKIGDLQKLRKEMVKNSVNGDVLDDTNIFGGNKFNVTSKRFRGGQVTCIFGGSEIDLTNAELDEGDQKLELSCVFGGTKLIVPADWDVVVDVTGILGGVSDKRHIVTDKYVDYSRRLHITGACVFGGGEISSVVRK
jgi:predicted membrane protein